MPALLTAHDVGMLMRANATAFDYLDHAHAICSMTNTLSSSRDMQADHCCMLCRYDEFVAKLPEPVRPFANAIYNAPTTGNFSRDLANVVSSITGQLNNLGRRLLRVL